MRLETGAHKHLSNVSLYNFNPFDKVTYVTRDQTSGEGTVEPSSDASAIRRLRNALNNAKPPNKNAAPPANE